MNIPIIVGSSQLDKRRNSRLAYQFTSGSPDSLIQNLVPESLQTYTERQYRNPVCLAREWQAALDRGEYVSPAELARSLVISRARVTQILRLLRLDPRVLERIADLGDPLDSQIVTERRLRNIVNLTPKEQLLKADKILPSTTSR